MEVVKLRKRNPFELFPMEIWEVLFDQMENSKDILTVLHGIPKLGISIGNQKRMWLIDQILPSLYNLIDQKDVLNLRLVCKQWLRRVDFFLQNQPYYRAYSDDLHKDNPKFWDFLNKYEKNKFVGPVKFTFYPSYNCNSERLLNQYEKDELEEPIITRYNGYDANPGLADAIVEYSQSTRRNPFVFRELSLEIVQTDPTYENNSSFQEMFTFLVQVGTHVWYLHIYNGWSFIFESQKYTRIQETIPFANLLKNTPNLKRLRLSLPLLFWEDTFEPKPNAINLPELPFLETIEILSNHIDLLTFESLGVILNRYGSQIRRLRIPVLKRWDVKRLANLFPQLTELELDVYIFNKPYEVEGFLINTTIILGTILSPNLVKLQINIRPYLILPYHELYYNVSFHDNISYDLHRTINIEKDILKWLKRFPRIKYFELLTHPSDEQIELRDEIVILKEEGTMDPSKDLFPSLQTMKIVDPGHRLSYNFLRCFPSVRTLQIKAFSRRINKKNSNRYLELVQSVKLYESNIWKVLPELRTASFAGWCIDDGYPEDYEVNHEFNRETFLKLKDAGMIPPEFQLPSTSTKNIQVFLDDKDNYDSGNWTSSAESYADDSESEPTSAPSTPVDRSREGSEQPQSSSTSGNGLVSSSSSAPKFGILIPNRIFVGGISSRTTEDELMQLFSKFGAIRGRNIILDHAGVSKGYGFVTFETEEEAKRLCNSTVEPIIHRGRRLKIAPAVKKQLVGQQDVPFSTPVNALSRPYDSASVYFPQTAQTHFFAQPTPFPKPFLDQPFWPGPFPSTSLPFYSTATDPTPSGPVCYMPQQFPQFPQVGPGPWYNHWPYPPQTSGLNGNVNGNPSHWRWLSPGDMSPTSLSLPPPHSTFPATFMPHSCQNSNGQTPHQPSAFPHYLNPTPATAAASTSSFPTPDPVFFSNSCVVPQPH